MSVDRHSTFAYSYHDPLLEPIPNGIDWGQDVDQIYQDLGDRQQLEQLLQRCQTHPDAYVLVRRLAELGDTVVEVSARLAELEALGIHLIAVEEPIATQGVDQTLRRSDLLALLHQLQQQQRQQQLQRGHARNRIQALPPPGKAPYGYRRGKDRYIVDRTTAPIVKDFFEHFLLYASLRGSVRYLQKKYNKKISVSTGQRWLTSPVYRGDLEYHTGDVIRETHQPILSREEAAQVDRLLRRNRRMPPRTASSPRSLSGLVQCSACQSPMKVSRVTSARAKQDYLYLTPTSCPNRPKCRALPYAQVLEKTIQQICQDLPRAVSGMQMPDAEGIKPGFDAQIAAKQTLLGKLPDLIEQGILDAETATLRAYKIRAEISDLQTRLAQLPPANLKTIAQVISIPQFWLDLSESERRFYFREFLRQIQIARPDPEQQEQGWQIALVFIF